MDAQTPPSRGERASRTASSLLAMFLPGVQPGHKKDSPANSEYIGDYLLQSSCFFSSSRS
jgi:hypothetical protein